jgi:predicted membrane channel-forming protein YqfA (hemolysin III family)
MVRVDLNAISIVGLVLGGIAAVFVFLEWQFQIAFPVSRIFGPDALYAEVPIAWIIAICGIVIYLIGRIVYVVKTRGGMPVLPKKTEED